MIRIERVHRETVERELKPYERWGMFTSKGNKRLKAIAQDAIDKLEKAKEKEGRVSTQKRRQVLVTYIVKWLRMQRTKSYGEAGDTAVREVVGDFHDKLYEATGGSRFDAMDAWERHLEEAYERVRC